jgi:hypothetical protein
MKILMPAAAVACTVNHPMISILIPIVLPILLPDFAPSCNFGEFEHERLCFRLRFVLQLRGIGQLQIVGFHLCLFLYLSWFETVFGTVPVSDRFDFLRAVTRRCRGSRAGYRTTVDGRESKAKWKPFAPPLRCASWARLRKDETEIQ